MGRRDFLLTVGRMGIAVVDLDEEEMRREFKESSAPKLTRAVLTDPEP